MLKSTNDIVQIILIVKSKLETEMMLLKRTWYVIMHSLSFFHQSRSKKFDEETEIVRVNKADLAGLRNQKGGLRE